LGHTVQSITCVCVPRAPICSRSEGPNEASARCGGKSDVCQAFSEVPGCFSENRTNAEREGQTDSASPCCSVERSACRTSSELDIPARLEESANSKRQGQADGSEADGGCQPQTSGCVCVPVEAKRNVAVAVAVLQKDSTDSWQDSHAFLCSAVSSVASLRNWGRVSSGHSLLEPLPTLGRRVNAILCVWLL
jgi:hypothetical protein